MSTKQTGPETMGKEFLPGNIPVFEICTNERARNRKINNQDKKETKISFRFHAIGRDLARKTEGNIGEKNITEPGVVVPVCDPSTRCGGACL